MKRLRTAIGALALAACLLVLAGCASASEPKPEAEPENTESAKGTTAQEKPVDLEIVESGWSTDEHGYANYGIGIVNPNAGFEAQQITLTVTGRDAEGKIVFTQDDIIPFMLPEATYYLGGQAGRGTPADALEFSLSVDERYWVQNDRTSSAIFEITNPNEMVEEYASVYTGELSANLNWDDVEHVRTCVLLRDDAGAIIYGTSGYADYPADGQSVPFEVYAPGAPEHATFELNAIPSW